MKLPLDGSKTEGSVRLVTFTRQVVEVGVVTLQLYEPALTGMARSSVLFLRYDDSDNSNVAQLDGGMYGRHRRKRV